MALKQRKAVVKYDGGGVNNGSVEMQCAGRGGERGGVEGEIMS